MFERLKQYPLVGLALAVAAGLVLAHLINEAADYLWYYYLADYLGENGWMVADLAVAALLLALFVWKRKSIQGWFERHKKGLAYGGLAILGAYSALVLVALLVRS